MILWFWLFAQNWNRHFFKKFKDMHNIENNKGLGGSLPFMKNLQFLLFKTI
jgi:hypothetical protein